MERLCRHPKRVRDGVLALSRWPKTLTIRDDESARSRTASRDLGLDARAQTVVRLHAYGLVAAPGLDEQVALAVTDAIVLAGYRPTSGLEAEQFEAARDGHAESMVPRSPQHVAYAREVGGSPHVFRGSSAGAAEFGIARLVLDGRGCRLEQSEQTGPAACAPPRETP